MLRKDLTEIREALERLTTMASSSGPLDPLAAIAILKLERVLLRNPEPDNAIPVRYFCVDEESEDPDFRECTESEFLEAEGRITYERNTVFENGCSQICLTKDPWADC